MTPYRLTRVTADLANFAAYIFRV